MVTTSGHGPALPALLEDRAAYQARLKLILPRAITGTPATDGPAGAASALTMIYVGAIGGSRPIRPVTLIRMSDGIAAHRTSDERHAYYQASMKTAANRAVDALCDAWGISRGSWYQANSREGPRDETFHAWADCGALLIDHSVPTTSGRGRYTLAPGFAALFDPGLSGDALDAAITQWQQANLGPIAKSRSQFRKMTSKTKAAVTVALPQGDTRQLDPGTSSEILKVLIEEAAPALLAEPHVIFISQSGQPVGTVDNAFLETAGLYLAKLKLLPDCLLIDAHDDGSLWFVEVVATDGPIDEERKAALLDWAVSAGVRPGDCRFLTAFESRTAGPAKKLLPVLARNSYAWYADEPAMLLRWEEIG